MRHRRAGKRGLAGVIALALVTAAVAVVGLVVTAAPSAAEDPLVAWDEDAFERAFFPGLDKVLALPMCLTQSANVTIEVRSPLDVVVHTIGPVSVPARGGYTSSGVCQGGNQSTTLVPQWNGRGANGQLVPAGIYTLVIRADAGAGAVSDTSVVTVEPATTTGTITVPSSGSTIGDTVSLSFEPSPQFAAEGPFRVTQVTFHCRQDTSWRNLATVNAPTGSAFSTPGPVAVPPFCDEGVNSLGVTTVFRDGGPSSSSQSFTTPPAHPVTLVTSPEAAFQNVGAADATFFPRMEPPRAFRYCTSEAGQVRIEVRRDGALVRSLYTKTETGRAGFLSVTGGNLACTSAPSSQDIQWDGTDDEGDLVAAGTYDVVLELVAADDGAATTHVQQVVLDGAARVGIVDSPAPGTVLTDRFMAGFRPDADFDGTPHRILRVDFRCGVGGALVRAEAPTEGVWSVDEALPVNCPQGEIDIAPQVVFQDPANRSHTWQAPSHVVRVSSPVQASWANAATPNRVLFPNLGEDQQIAVCANRDAVVDIDVLDADGEVLRRLVEDGAVARGQIYEGTRQSCWAGIDMAQFPRWDGALADGTLLPAGDYQLRLTATDSDGNVATDTFLRKLDTAATVGAVTSPEVGAELVGELTATFRPAARFAGSPHEVIQVSFPCLPTISAPDDAGDFTTTVEAPESCRNVKDFAPFVSFADELGSSHGVQLPAFAVNGSLRVGWVGSSVAERVFLPGIGETMSLRLCLSRAASVRTEVVNAGGAVVRTFGPEAMEAAGSPAEDGGCIGSTGRTQATWDGRAANGTTLPDGRYTLRVVAVAGDVTATDTAPVHLDGATSLGTPLEPTPNAAVAGLVRFTYDPTTSFTTDDVQVCVSPPGGPNGCRTILNPSEGDGHWRTTNPASNLRDGAASVTFVHRATDQFGFRHTYQPPAVPITVDTTSVPVELTATPASGDAPLTSLITLRASDPLLRPLDYELSFGAGALPVTGTLESPYPDHTVEVVFHQPGSHLVQARVDNHVGPQVTRSITVVVHDPNATTTSSTTTVPGSSSTTTTTSPSASSTSSPTSPTSSSTSTTTSGATSTSTTIGASSTTTTPSSSSSTTSRPGSSSTTVPPGTTPTTAPPTTSSTRAPSTTLERPSVRVTPDPAVPGEPITVRLTGWAPQVGLRLVLFSDPIDLGRLRTDGNGRAMERYGLPRDLPPGVHRIEVTGLDRFDATATAIDTFVVGEPEPEPPPVVTEPDEPGPGPDPTDGGTPPPGPSDPVGPGQPADGSGPAPVPAAGRGSAAAVPFADPGRATAAPGQAVRVTGDDFRPLSQGTITLIREGTTTAVELGSFTADQLGSVAADPVLPAGLSPGLHHLRLTGVDDAGIPRVVTIPIYVGTGDVLGSATLPRTGSATDELQRAGLVLLWAGAVLVLLGRLGLLPVAGGPTHRSGVPPHQRRRR